MFIRKWEYTDNLQIADLERQIFEDYWTTQMINDAFLSDNFIGFVMDKSSKIIGYVGGTLVLDEGEICLVAVSKENRGKKIATKLLTKFLKALKEKGCKKVFLEVRRTNIIAQNLYLKQGFNFVGVREKYYGGKEDAFIMCKEI